VHDTSSHCATIGCRSVETSACASNVLEKLARAGRTIPMRGNAVVREACAAAALEQPTDAIAELRPRIGQVS